MEGYMSVAFEKLPEEDIQFFQREFIAVMENFQKPIDEIEETRRNGLNQGKKKDKDQLSGFGKVLSVARKILVNTAISHFTGTDPTFLDNDSEFLKMNQAQRNYYYKRCDIAVLAYSISKDLKDGMAAFLDLLKEEDINKLIPVLYSIQNTYIGVYPSMDIGATSFEPVLYRIFDRANIFGLDEFEKYTVMYKRGYMLGVSRNLIRDFDNVYKKYAEMNSGKVSDEAQK